MTILAGTDDEFQSMARRDLTEYAAALARDDLSTCIVIERRYGLFGLSPQRVSEELADIAAAQEVLP